MYFSAWFFYPEIISNPSLWKPSIGYELDEGKVMRLIGFAKDPNFYSLWISLAFFIGFSRSLSLSRLVVLATIGVSLVLAMSRTFGLAILISTIILILYSLAMRVRSREYIYRVLIGVAIIATASYIITFFMNYNLISFLIERVMLANATPRFDMWQQILGKMGETWNPIIGAGLRGAEIALEGNYSHNSYLDVLFETGLIGFLLWSFMLYYTTLSAVKRINYPEWCPWVQTWLVLLVMFAFFSISYNPFLWLIAGILTGSPLEPNLPKSSGAQV
jgi:O-antigen ligase